MVKLPDRIDEDGFFPFGRPNRPRAASWHGSTSPKQLVIGVYPSALHVSWTAPVASRAPDRTARVAALAVDVEPSVFWDGADAVPKIRDWFDAVGFQDG